MAEFIFKQVLIEKVTHPNTTLKGLKFAARREAVSAEPEEMLDADLSMLATEIEALKPSKPSG